MKTARKNMIHYLLLSAWLIMFFHAVIPHDHHYSTNCEHTHHQHQGFHSGDNHCYFFNDVVVDDTKFQKKRFSSGVSPFDFTAVFSLQTAGVYIDTPSLFTTEFIFTSQNSFLENIPVRGSPFLV